MTWRCPTILLRQLALFHFVLLSLFLASACDQSASVERPDGEVQGRPDVILISIDTLRYDHLGLYGYDVPTSPALDAFANESVVFTQAISQGPSTLVSHASMFTSQIPAHHGASWSKKTAIKKSVPTLAETLQAAGYKTVGFHAGGQMDPAFGPGRGFDQYTLKNEQDFAKPVEEALEWIDSQDFKEQAPRRPFFLFLHTYSVHHPYTPDEEHLQKIGVSSSSSLPTNISVPYLKQLNGRIEPKIDLAPGDLEHIVRSYDAEIRAMDEGFEKLVQGLKSKGLFDDSLIVFTSDHGEEFMEHGMVGWHSHSLFDELLRVPLLIKFPGQALAGTRVTNSVRSIDIMPTILDRVALEAPDSVEGISLWTQLNDPNPSPSPLAISQRDGPRALNTSVRSGQQKLITWQQRNVKGIQHLLFDLTQDPGEQHNITEQEPETYAQLLELIRSVEDGSRSATPVDLSKETEAQLRALGYID